MVKIIHVGYPVDHPEVPVEMREKVRKGLDDLVTAMRAKGLDYKLVLISENELNILKDEIVNGQPDGIVIGGGVLRGNVVNFELILNVIHENASKGTKLMPIGMPPDTYDAIKRNFNV